MKFLQLFLLLGALCFARDNPFVSVENISNFTQAPKKDNSFKEKDFTLPDSARVLKKVEVFYQNLNGSVSKQMLNIDKKIDWHKKFIISYKNSRILTKPEKKIQAVEKKPQPKRVKEVIKTFSFKDFIAFKVGKKSMKIITKDSKIRDFIVSEPYKIVIDFKRDTNFLTKTFKINLPPFVSIVLGNHDKYYRVVVELDGQYIYSLKKEEGDYIITLK